MDKKMKKREWLSALEQRVKNLEDRLDAANPVSDPRSETRSEGHDKAIRAGIPVRDEPQA